MLAVGAPIATAWRLGGDAFDSRVDRWRCSHAIARCSYRNCRFFPVELRGHGRYAIVRSLCTLPLYAVEASPTFHFRSVYPCRSESRKPTVGS